MKVKMDWRKRANRAEPPVENIAVSFLGLGLLKKGEEVEDYSDRGFNRDKVYTVTEGITMTKEELEERAKDPAIKVRARARAERTGLRSMIPSSRPVDQIGYEGLRQVVPPNYLPRNNSSTD